MPKVTLKHDVLISFQYVDFYRPRFFILENVRNFANFQKGKVLELVFRTLIKMGYQCTYAILQVFLLFFKISVKLNVQFLTGFRATALPFEKFLQMLKGKREQYYKCAHTYSVYFTTL